VRVNSDIVVRVVPSAHQALKILVFHTTYNNLLE
jgi:hypothetical protein